MDGARRFSEEVFGVLFTVLLLLTIAMDSCTFSGMIISKTTMRREWSGWRLAFWRVLAYLIPTGTNPRVDSLEQ